MPTVNTGLNTEFIADTVGAMVTGNTETSITVTYQDADNTIDFEVTAASDTAAGAIEIAIQSEMETGTDTGRAVVPGRQHFHPSAAKQWVKFNVSGTIAASYNTTSITDNSTGNWTVIIATDMSSGNYCVLAGGSYVSAGTLPIAYHVGTNQNAGDYQIVAYQANAAATPADPTAANTVFAVAFGDL